MRQARIGYVQRVVSFTLNRTSRNQTFDRMDRIYRIKNVVASLAARTAPLFIPPTLLILSKEPDEKPCQCLVYDIFLSQITMT